MSKNRRDNPCLCYKGKNQTSGFCTQPLFDFAARAFGMARNTLKYIDTFFLTSRPITAAFEFDFDP